MAVVNLNHGSLSPHSLLEDTDPKVDLAGTVDKSVPDAKNVSDLLAAEQSLHTIRPTRSSIRESIREFLDTAEKVLKVQKHS